MPPKRKPSDKTKQPPKKKRAEVIKYSVTGDERSRPPPDDETSEEFEDWALNTMPLYDYDPPTREFCAHDFDVPANTDLTFPANPFGRPRNEVMALRDRDLARDDPDLDLSIFDPERRM